MSAMCHYRKGSALFDHLVGAAEQRWQDPRCRVVLPSCRPQHHWRTPTVEYSMSALPPRKRADKSSDQKPAPGIKQNTSSSMPSFKIQVRRLQRWLRPSGLWRSCSIFSGGTAIQSPSPPILRAIQFPSSTLDSAGEQSCLWQHDRARLSGIIQVE